MRGRAVLNSILVAEKEIGHRISPGRGGGISGVLAGIRESSFFIADILVVRLDPLNRAPELDSVRALDPGRVVDQLPNLRCVEIGYVVACPQCGVTGNREGRVHNRTSC